MDCTAHQAPLSMDFSWPEYWSSLLFPPPGDHLNPGIETPSPTSPALAGRFTTTEPPGKPLTRVMMKLQFSPYCVAESCSDLTLECHHINTSQLIPSFQLALSRGQNEHLPFLCSCGVTPIPLATSITRLCNELFLGLCSLLSGNYLHKPVLFCSWLLSNIKHVIPPLQVSDLPHKWEKQGLDLARLSSVPALCIRTSGIGWRLRRYLLFPDLRPKWGMWVLQRHKITHSWTEIGGKRKDR